jgi:hypothetical protein
MDEERYTQGSLDLDRARRGLQRPAADSGASPVAAAAYIRDAMLYNPTVGHLQIEGSGLLALMCQSHPAAVHAFGPAFLTVLRAATLSHAASPAVLAAALAALARVCDALPALLPLSAAMRFVPCIDTALKAFPLEREMVAGAVMAARVLMRSPDNRAAAVAVGLVQTLQHIGNAGNADARRLLADMGVAQDRVWPPLPPPLPPLPPPPLP